MSVCDKCRADRRCNHCGRSHDEPGVGFDINGDEFHVHMCPWCGIEFRERNIRPLCRRHLVRYEDNQTTTLCGLPIIREGKWPRMARLDTKMNGTVVRCTTCDERHEAEIEEFAAEYVYEGIVA